MKTVFLTPPLLSADHIKEKITCIRAHRERIFQVSAEIKNNQLIVHNYGHGGAGWTFLFGCVNESLRLFGHYAEKSQFHKKPITVIGAGCYGLLTAIELARKGYQVSIVAKDTQNIPSNKAAGFFFPRWRKCSTQEEISVFLARGMESYKTYLEISQGNHPFINEGPKIVPAYYSPDIDPGFVPYSDAKLMQTPQDKIIDFGNGKQYKTMEYQTVFINTAVIMQELWRNIHELKIPVNHAEITSFEAIQEPIIFNCSGMGAQKLTNDPRIVPVQGHLITLQHQPSPESLQYMLNVKVLSTDTKGRPRDELIYFAPKNQGILGITFLRGQADDTANQHEFDRLLQRSQEFFGT